MTPLDFDPDLQRLGDALFTSTTRDLAREQATGRPGRSRRREAGVLRRPRVIAGSSLGLAGVGAGLVLALSGTAATAPAFAITPKTGGSIFIKINSGGQNTLLTADRRLIAEYGETVLITTAAGPSSDATPLECVPTRDVDAPGDPAPAGPRVTLLVGTDNTFTIPAGDTGAGTEHVTGCQTYVSTPNHSVSPTPGKPLPATPIAPGTNNTGNTGNTGN